MKSPRIVFWLCAVIALDMAGIGLIFPVLGPLVAENVLLPASLSLVLRDLLYGLLVASPSLVMLLASPIIGDLSDLHGRRPLLLFSLFLLMLGYGISGYGIVEQSFIVFLIGRLFNGIAGASQSIAKAALGDQSTPETYVRNMGRMTLASGGGLVGGASIGALLSDSTLFPGAGFAVPYVFMAGVSGLFAIAFIQFIPKTVLKHHRSSSPKQPLLVRFRQTWISSQQRYLAAAFCLLLCSWGLFTQYAPLFASDQVQFRPAQLGGMMLLLGLCLAIGIEGILPQLTKSQGTQKSCRLGFVTVALGALVLLSPWPRIGLWIATVLIATGMGISYTGCFALLADGAGTTARGKTMGIADALSALAMGVTGLAGGALYAASWSLPFVVAAIAAFLAWRLLKRWA